MYPAFSHRLPDSMLDAFFIAGHIGGSLSNLCYVLKTVGTAQFLQLEFSPASRWNLVSKVSESCDVQFIRERVGARGAFLGW